MERMQMPMEGEFTTRDLHLAAFLLGTDHPLLRLNGREHERAFTFGNVTDEHIRHFYAGAPSDARKVLNALRDLKGLLQQGAQR